MGEVYAAYDTRLRRSVAIKHIRSSPGDDDHRRARLRREARVVAQLAHPCIVQVFDILERDDGDWIVMEMVQGDTLAAQLKDGPATVGPVLRWARDIADALTVAHRRGIVHRDLKVENVMLTEEGWVKVLDFGIAKQIAAGPDGEDLGTASLSVEGQIIGTVRTMSPEQARGVEVDERSDLFSLGVLIYEALAGVSPFLGATHLDTLMRVNSHQQKPLVECSGLVEGVPPALSELVDQLLEKAPELRPANAAEVVARLDAIAASRTGGFPATQDMPVPKSTRGADPDATMSLAGAGNAATAPSVATGPTRTGTPVPVPRQAALTRPGTPAPVPPRSAATHAATPVPPPRPATGSESIPVTAATGSAFVPTVTSSGPAPAAAVAPPRRRWLWGLGLAAVVVGGAAALMWPSRPTHEDAAPSPSETSTPTARVDVPEDEPADPRAWYRQGMEHLKNFHRPDAVESAEALFQKILRHDEDSAAGHAGLARAYHHRYADPDADADPVLLRQAMDVAERAVTLDPMLADAKVSHGLVLVEYGRLDEAEADFRSALTLAPNNGDAYAGLAKVHEQRQAWDEAEAAYREAIARTPDDRRYHDDLGEFLYQRGRYDEAAAQFQKSIELAPDSIYGYSNLGATHVLQGRYAEAATAFQQALEIRPSASLYSNLGTVLFAQGLYAPAANAFERALAMDGSANAYLYWGNLADAYRQLPGAGDDAREHYQRAVALLDQELTRRPDDLTARTRRALYLAKADDCDHALADIDQLDADDIDAPYPAFRRAVVLELCGRRKPAITALDRALALGFSEAELEADPELRKLRADPNYHRMRARRERKAKP